MKKEIHVGEGQDEDMTSNPWDWIDTMNRIFKILGIRCKMLCLNRRYKMRDNESGWFLGDLFIKYKKDYVHVKDITFEHVELNKDAILKRLKYKKEWLKKEGIIE